MAYIPQEDEDSQEVGLNVMGGGQQPSPQTEPTTSGQPAPGSPAGAPASQTGGQPQAQGKQPRGSGMFTDVRKYVQANKPAGQRIGGAVSKGVQKKAQDIRGQVQQQQQQAQQRIAENRAKLAQERQFAQTATQQAGQGPLSDQDVARFQALTRGQTRFDEGVAPLATGQQQVRAKALEGIAQQAGRAAGRERLLRETFGQGRQYTRGQQAIDSLLLASSPAAQQMAGDIRQDVSGISGEISQARRQQLQDIAGLRQEAGQLMGKEGEAARTLATAQQNLKAELERQAGTYGEKKLAEDQAFRQQMLDKITRFQDFTPEEAARLGIDEKYLPDLARQLARSRETREFGLHKYITDIRPETYEGALATAASPEQQARFAQLSKLAGREQQLQDRQSVVGPKFEYDRMVQDLASMYGVNAADLYDEAGNIKTSTAEKIAQAAVLGGPMGASAMAALEGAKKIGRKIGL